MLDRNSKVLLKMEGRGVLQDLIPDVGQLELGYVPIEQWIIDPEVHDLLDGPGNTVHLPTHYGEIVHTDVMTLSVTLVKDGRIISYNTTYLMGILLINLLYLHSYNASVFYYYCVK